MGNLFTVPPKGVIVVTVNVQHMSIISHLTKSLFL